MYLREPGASLVLVHYSVSLKFKLLQRKHNKFAILALYVFPYIPCDFPSFNV